MSIVDRSVDPVLHLDYDIPMEDVEFTDDELEDSRTHQFFAFCRSRTPQEFMPRWITWADVERATAIGIAPANIYDADVLETSEAWTDCWHRITADDDRRPITFEAAAQGIDWDTSGLPVGAYVLDGYTWEPPSNLWTPCPSVVKVVDDPDPGASPPAASITTKEVFLEPGETVTLQGCVSAEEGAVLSASWAVPTAEVVWEPIVEDEPVAGSEFSFVFDPPDALAGAGLMVRVRVDDPSGRSYTAHMIDRVFLVGDDPGECDDGSLFVGGSECGGSSSGGESSSSSGDGPSETSSSGTSGGASDDAVAGSDDGEDPGCGCRSRGSAPLPALFALLLVRRRSRRDR